MDKAAKHKEDQAYYDHKKMFQEIYSQIVEGTAELIDCNQCMDEIDRMIDDIEKQKRKLAAE